MRKPTYAQLTEALQSADRQATLFMLATQYLIRDQARVIARHSVDGSHYTYRVCGETRGDGGLVLISHHCANQQTDTRVNYIDLEYQHARDHAHASDETREHYASMHKCVMYRNSKVEAR